MIKTPLSTVLGGAFWTPEATVINGAKLSFETVMKKLFANNEQGFFYDPNDLSTMFQDAAGTVPVTGAGQPVGLMLDKSKGLVVGEELSKITSPFTVFRDAASNIISPSVATLSAGKTYLVVTDISDNPQGISDWRVSGSSLNTISTTQVGAKAGRHTCILTVIGGSNLQLFGSNVGTSITVNAVSVRQLFGNHAYQTTSASRPLLQRNATTGAYYLALDGVDDFFTTNSINFTATDAMSLFSCSVNTSHVDFQNIVELGIPPINGTFLLRCPQSSSKPAYITGGTVNVQLQSTAGSSILSGTVLSCVSKISTDTLRIRFNGFENSSNADQGTGNYGNHPVYIGARGDASRHFRGRIYGLIGVGKLVLDNETAAIEKELAKRTGVTLSV